MRTSTLPIGGRGTQHDLREDEGLNVWSLLFPGSQVSAKNTRATRLCSSCFTSQFQRNPNNGAEDAWEMLLSGAGICTNVLLSQLGSKSGLQLECVYLRGGLCRQQQGREQWVLRRRKERFQRPPFFLLLALFSLTKGDIFSI